MKTLEISEPELEVKSLRRREIHRGDRLFYWSLRIGAWSILMLLLTMVGMILWLSWPALAKDGLAFFVSSKWDHMNQEFGALTVIYGTVVSSMIALLMAVPVSVGVALFLNEIAPTWLARILGFLVEMLAAVPSIVFGLWGLFVMVPFLRDPIQPFLSQYFGFLPIFAGAPIGVGMMAAGVVLGIMITPTILSICREVFKAIPVANREAALGLGATRWEMLRISVLRSSVSGVFGAVILGLGRALGETMAVTMVIGNKPQILASLFAPAQTMASVLANQYAEADSDHHLAALTGVGLALFIVSLFVNGIARSIVKRVERKAKGVVA